MGVSVFVLLPFGDAVRRSFFEAMSGKFVGLANYKTVLQNEAFRTAVRNTLRFLGTCIPLLILLSLVLAVLLGREKKHGDFFKTSFLVPMAIPVASVVLLWRIFFHQNGLLNVLTGQTVDWLYSEGTFYVLVFSYLWKNAGYDMVLWLAGLSGISPALYEAARVDGAGPLQQFLFITLPQMLPTLFIITVLSLLNAFKVFREAYLIAGDYPHESIYMLQHLFNNWFVSLDIQKMCAAAVLVALCIFVVILLFQKFWGKEDTE